MGIIIYLFAFIIEIILFFYCVTTKSYQVKVRSIIRILEFLCFTLFTILKVFEWSSRYYALAITLALMAIFGVLSITYIKKYNTEYNKSNVIKRTIGMTILFFLVTIPVLLFPQYKIIRVTGDYQVTTVTHTYTDVNRVETFTNTGENRKVNVGIWYPENVDGTFPLIVFSHGGISNKESNESLFNELASNGYVVFSIDHTYHSLSTTDEDGKTITINSNYMKELQRENARENPQQSYEYYQKWMKLRTDDINFVIDYIISEVNSNNSERIYKLIDTTKVGVIGHSLGGSAALCMGRMRDNIKAVIALESPFMCDIKGVKDGEFVIENELYPTPVLNVYSDSTWNRLSELPQYVQNYKYLSKTEATVFNVHISGVGHFSLTDLALSSPILTRLFNGLESTKDKEYCLEIINKVSLEFLDSYLKGKGEFNSSGSY